MFELIALVVLIAGGAFLFYRAQSKGIELIDEITESPISSVSEKKAEPKPVKAVAAAKPAATKKAAPKSKAKKQA